MQHKLLFCTSAASVFRVPLHLKLRRSVIMCFSFHSNGSDVHKFFQCSILFIKTVLTLFCLTMNNAFFYVAGEVYNSITSISFQVILFHFYFVFLIYLELSKKNTQTMVSIFMFIALECLQCLSDLHLSQTQ